MNHTLRSFKSEDQDGVKDLILTVLSKEYPFDKTAYSDSDLLKIGQTYGGQRNAFFVIEEKGKVVGTVGIKEDSPGEALLRRLFVSASCRGHGYGTELLEKAVDFCKSNGYMRIYFRCTDRMNDAMKLCMKKGFKETEKLEVGGFNIHKLEFAI